MTCVELSVYPVLILRPETFTESVLFRCGNKFTEKNNYIPGTAIMDQPSGSNMSSSPEDMNTDAPDNLLISRKRGLSNDNIERASGSGTKANNENCFGTNLRSIVTECETRIRNYVKRQKLERNAAANYNMFIQDDDSSNSSSFSFASSDEDIFTDYVEEPSIYTQRARHRQMKKERSTFGPWLFLSFVEGGCSYKNMKNFLVKEYGVKCQRSRTNSYRVTMAGEYNAIIKFKSSEELNQIINSLNERKMNDKFVFLSFDKQPLEYYNSDSSDEDTSFGPSILMAKGV